jgi:hypothetical protein
LPADVALTLSVTRASPTRRQARIAAAALGTFANKGLPGHGHDRHRGGDRGAWAAPRNRTCGRCRRSPTDRMNGVPIYLAQL